MNYKLLTKEELDYIFENENFKTLPMYHQLYSIAFAADKNEVCFFHGIGTGKSLCALYTHLVWNTKRTLIVCPNSVIETTWKKQIEEHTDSSYTLLQGTKEKRKSLLENGSRFFVVNYEGLLPLFKSPNPEEIFSWKLIEDANFDGLIVDESQNTKNFDTKHTQICAAISQNSNKSLIMTGTPTLKDFRELWSQYYVLDQGKTLGNSWWGFLHKYFIKFTIKLKNPIRNIPDWKPKKGSEEKVLDRLRTNTIRVNREDCLDLPEIVYQQLEVEMTKEQKDTTKKLIDDIKIEGVDLGNVLNKSEKLRQLAGGFLYNTNKKATLLKENKTKEIVGLINQIDTKVIIFHHYQAEGVLLEKMCRKYKIKFASMRGEIKDKQKQYDKFMYEQDVKVLIAHPLSAGTGVDGFQHICQTIIFYCNETHLVREQCIGRILREGQKNECLIIDIICKNSIDEIKFENMEEDKTRAKKLLKYVQDFE